MSQPKSKFPIAKGQGMYLSRKAHDLNVWGPSTPISREKISFCFEMLRVPNTYKMRPDLTTQYNMTSLIFVGLWPCPIILPPPPPEPVPPPKLTQPTSNYLKYKSSLSNEWTFLHSQCDLPEPPPGAPQLPSFTWYPTLHKKLSSSQECLCQELWNRRRGRGPVRTTNGVPASLSTPPNIPRWSDIIVKHWNIHVNVGFFPQAVAGLWPVSYQPHSSGGVGHCH